MRVRSVMNHGKRCFLVYISTPKRKRIFRDTQREAYEAIVDEAERKRQEGAAARELSEGQRVDAANALAALEKALNFDESVRQESLIDWEALKATVPGEVARCMELFRGIVVEDTRACLLAALRRLRDPDAAQNFEHNFKSLERLWEAVAPDPCLYPHRHQYNWLCTIYVAYRRRQRGDRGTFGELSAKTRQLIEENTSFIELVEALPVFKIDKDYVTRLDELPTPADKAAALEAALTRELFASIRAADETQLSMLHPEDGILPELPTNDECLFLRGFNRIARLRVRKVG